MDRELQELIKKFYEKLGAAQDARLAVMDYLEDKYDIDTVAMYERLESDCDWCYGINLRALESLIGK